MNGSGTAIVYALSRMGRGVALGGLEGGERFWEGGRKEGRKDWRKGEKDVGKAKWREEEGGRVSCPKRREGVREIEVRCCPGGEDSGIVSRNKWVLNYLRDRDFDRLR